LEGSEFDKSKIVGVVLLEAGGDSAEVLELVEEAFDGCRASSR
jgi:hypothetical protein